MVNSVLALLNMEDISLIRAANITDISKPRKPIYENTNVKQYDEYMHDV